MKIALISDIPQDRPFSGPQRTTKGLAEALQSGNMEVTVIGYRGDSSMIDCPTKIIDNEISSFNLSLLKFQRDAIRWINKKNFDIVHTWEPLIPQPFLNKGVDIFSVHGVAFLEEAALSPTVKQRIAAAVHTLQATITSKRAYTVAQSSRTKDDATKCGLSIDDTVPVGIENRFLQPNICSDERILYVSRINDHKNQAEVVQVARQADLNLRLVGPVSDRTYAESIPGFDQYYAGRLSESELLEEYARAAVYVLPSKHEGFGLTALEAMAAGTPVVVSDECGVRDIIEEGENGYVYTRGNHEQLLNYVNRCLDNRSQMSRVARETAETLTWDRIADEYVEMYNRMTERRNGNGLSK